MTLFSKRAISINISNKQTIIYSKISTNIIILKLIYKTWAHAKPPNKVRPSEWPGLKSKRLLSRTQIRRWSRMLWYRVSVRMWRVRTVGRRCAPNATPSTNLSWMRILRNLGCAWATKRRMDVSLTVRNSSQEWARGIAAHHASFTCVKSASSITKCDRSTLF